MPEAVARSDTAKVEVARATWAVVQREGIAGASMREIAREAGFTTGVLTHHFRDKDELLLFAFTLAFESAAERVAEVSRRGDDPVKALTAVLEEGLPLDAQRRVEATIYFGFLDVARRGGRLAEEFQRRHELWRELVIRLVSAATRASARDRSDIADMLLIAVDGIASSALADPGRFDERRQRQLLQRAVAGQVQPRRA